VAASHNAQVSPGAAGVAHRSGEKRRQRRFERAEMVGNGNEEQKLGRIWVHDGEEGHDQRWRRWRPSAGLAN